MYFGDIKPHEISDFLLDGDGVVIDENNQFSYHIENYNGCNYNSQEK